MNGGRIKNMLKGHGNGLLNKFFCILQKSLFKDSTGAGKRMPARISPICFMLSDGYAIFDAPATAPTTDKLNHDSL